MGSKEDSLNDSQVDEEITKNDKAPGSPSRQNGSESNKQEPTVGPSGCDESQAIMSNQANAGEKTLAHQGLSLVPEIESGNVQTIKKRDNKVQSYVEFKQKTLTDEELLIANPGIDEEDDLVCYYFRSKCQCWLTLMLSAIFVAGIVLMGVYFPRYLNCSIGCVSSVQHLKRCFANSREEDLRMCPGTYSVYAPLQIYPERNTTVSCDNLSSPEAKCTFSTPSDNMFYIINFGAGNIKFQNIIFTSSVTDETKLSLFTPTFQAGQSTINFDACSFVNSPQGFAFQTKSSNFTNCLISGNGASNSYNNVPYDDSCTAFDFSPTVLSQAGQASFYNSVFEFNLCGSTVNYRRSSRTNVGGTKFTNCTFQYNQADHMIRLGGPGLANGGVSFKTCEIFNNAAESSLIRMQQNQSKLIIEDTKFASNHGPILSTSNVPYVTLINSSLSSNVINVPSDYYNEDGEVAPMISVAGASEVLLGNVIINLNQISIGASDLVSVTNLRGNSTFRTSNCTITSNSVTGAIISASGSKSLIGGRCQNQGSIVFENSSFVGNSMSNPTKVQGLLNAECASSIVASSIEFLSNLQASGNATASDFEALVSFTTAPRQQSLVQRCLFQENVCGNVAVALNAGNGLLSNSLIQQSCFRANIFGGPAAASMPYSPNNVQLLWIRSSNFFADSNVFLDNQTFGSATQKCFGLLHGTTDSGSSQTCDAFESNFCPWSFQ